MKRKNYPDCFITLEKAKKPRGRMTFLSSLSGNTMTKVLSLFFLLFFTTLTTSGSDQHAIVGWNYGNGKVMYCGLGYMMSTSSSYWGDFFQHNAQKTLFVNMVKMNSYVTNPVVGIFYSPGSTGYPNSITADSLIAILGRSGITGVKVTSDMIDTQAEINNYNVLILGGSGQYGGEISAGYLTVQTVVKNFVQNDHGGVIFTGWSVFTLLGIGATDYNDMIPVELSPDYGYQDSYTLLKHLPSDPLFEGVGTVASTGYCEFPMGNMKSGATAYAGLSPYVPYELPTVTTAAITNYNATSATMGGNVTAEGTSPVTSRGVVYSSTDNTPQLGESGVIADANGSGTGSFSESIEGLTAGFTYYVRAYATSSSGTGYGSTESFTTPSCINPTNGGSVTGTQSGCTPFIPEVISSSALPTGYLGVLEYKWQSSTTGNSTGFSDISESNTDFYNPGALLQTTWFKRIARVACASWTGAAESNVVQITVEPASVAGTLTKTPDVMNVCENDIVSAVLTAGNGGNGIDELEFRTNNGTWTAWAAYTSGTNILTADLSGVEIRTRRMATYCENSAYTTIGWSVEATPVAGLLTKTPDVMNICENDIVSAVLTAGNGGNGIDELEFRTNNGTWSAWAAYTSGANISTADLSGVEIRTRRAASTCSSSAYTTIGWTVEATPIAGLLTKTPDVLNVCENDIVSAVLTAGNGGNGIDELEFRTNNGTWSAWAAYTSGTNISTADLSGIEIRTRRTASYCENSAYTTIGWSVEATPVTGLLTKTPDVMNVCENDFVSAVLTAGNGGNGIDELEFRTNNGTWAAWAAYTSGANISTADLSGVEIRTRRAASTCSPSEYTAISWIVEATPVAGLLVKNPDINQVCIGELVSATFTAGTGGNGADYLEYRTNDGSAWTEWNVYISGTSISTSDLTAVEIRTWRTATYCENSDYSVVSWIVNPLTVGGVVEGPEGVCIGTNSTTLVALGYTGSIVMWQTSTDYWATITNIQHTEPTLLVENLTVITQYRTVIQSGNCDQLYSVAAEIGVEDYPAPFITGEEVICDLNQIYEYSTEPEMVNYQWNITSGQILSGQGTSLITVQWNGSGEQTISVDYQTVFGCTMPEPFVMDIEILTPETPVITIEGFTLSSSASEGNQWYLNGNIIEGATSHTYEVTENGEYTCVVTLNDCSSEVSNTIAVLNVGSDPSLSFSMEVYPVPNNGLFTVKLFTPGNSEYSLTIYNALGSVVYSRESIVVHGGFSQMIDLTNSPTGIYTLVMQNANNRFVRKVVINK